MNRLVSKVIVLTLIGLVVQLGSAIEQQQQLTANENRQARSVSSNGNGHGINNPNGIEYHFSNKARIENERQQIAEFFTPKNVIKQIIKLFIGSKDEQSASSRNVLNVLSSMLELLRNSFGQKSRSHSARTIRDSAEDVAFAGVTMLQGYVKSVLATDEACKKRYLCQASRDAVREGKDLGYMVATLGGYASSYMLENSENNKTLFKELHQASQKGKQTNEDCTKLYQECSDDRRHAPSE